MSKINNPEMTERIIVLLDMDCFYVQVEERDNPQIRGVPAAVVQYNTWKGGGIIAVNYEARAEGVKRNMRGDEAKAKCPTIQLVKVPMQREKANLTKYRNACNEVMSVLCEFSNCVEKASVDEAYIDLTDRVRQLQQDKTHLFVTPQQLPNTHIVGYDKAETTKEAGLSSWLNCIKFNCSSEGEIHCSPDMFADGVDTGAEQRLGLGAVICEEMRKSVLQKTGFKCSAGIAHNKVLAKLACGLHKPNQQTVLPQRCLSQLWSDTSVGKVRHLGGKLGEAVVKELNCDTMDQLAQVPLSTLCTTFDAKTGHWLHDLAKGIDTETVVSRQMAKSIGCGKNFPGSSALDTKEKVLKWLQNLSEELSERLIEDHELTHRTAKNLSIHVRCGTKDTKLRDLSRSCSLPSYNNDRIASVALCLIQHLNTNKDKSLWTPPLQHIGLSASKFEEATKGCGSIQKLFAKALQKNETNASNVADVTDVPLHVDENSCDGIENLYDEEEDEDICKEISVIKSEAEESNESNTSLLNGERSSITKEDVILIQNKSSFKNTSEILEKAHNKLSSKSFFRTVFEQKRLKNIEDRNSLDKETKGESSGVASESFFQNKMKRKRQEEEKNNKIIKTTKSTFIGNAVETAVNTEYTNSSVYDASTDEDIEVEEINNDLGIDSKTSQDNTEDNTDLNECSISVAELFPDLDCVDEGIVTMLPAKMRKKVQEAIALHKAKKAGREALLKTAIWKFVENEGARSSSNSEDEINKLTADNIANTSLKEYTLTHNNTNNDIPGDSTIRSSSNSFISAINKNLSPKVESNSGSVGFVSKGNLMQCRKCEAYVVKERVQEHSDFHLAVDLRQEQLSQRTQPKKSVVAPQKKHKGRPIKGSKINSKDSKMSTLDHYFNKR